MQKTQLTLPTLLACSLLSLSAGSTAQAVSLEDSVTHQFPAASFERMELSAINGAITCESSDSDLIQITAMRKVKAGSDAEAQAYLDQIQVEIEEDGTTLRVETKLPKSKGGFWQWIAGKNVNASVQYQVSVPSSIHVKLESVNGAISAEGLSGEVDCETVNGGIRASGIGSMAKMETVNGSIHCEFSTSALLKPSSFETVNGSIKVHLPAAAACEVDIQTVNGGIHCDFELPADAVKQRRELRASINGGGPKVSLETVNGSASIYALGR